VQTRNVGDGRTRAGGDQDALASKTLAVHLNGVSVDQAGLALFDAELTAHKPVVLLLAVVEDDLVLLGDQLAKVDPQSLTIGRETRVAWVTSVMKELRCLNQVLGRQATPVDAGPPYGAALDHNGGLAPL